MLDLLWNKYWVNTLSSSPLLGTRDLRTGQIADIGERFDNPSLTTLPAPEQHCVFQCYQLLVCCMHDY